MREKAEDSEAVVDRNVHDAAARQRVAGVLLYVRSPKLARAPMNVHNDRVWRSGRVASHVARRVTRSARCVRRTHGRRRREYIQHKHVLLALLDAPPLETIGEETRIGLRAHGEDA